MNNCAYCNKPIDRWLNYCDYVCQIDHAKTNPNCKIITPNRLPITVITHDYKLMEHYNADHKDYMFPIQITDPNYEENNYMAALLYTDGHVVISLYEGTYKMFTYDYHSKVFSDHNGASVSLESTRKIIKHVMENKAANQY